MKNKNILLIAGITIFILVAIFLNSKDSGSSENQLTENQVKKQVADKIEVVHFHATQQCWSCITVGEYALKTIKEKFPEEYKSGKIVFMDINGELVINRDIVTKFQAGGSSLFVNTIIDGKDNITEDTDVWRLVGNEIQFTNYFQNKLNNLLGK